MTTSTINLDDLKSPKGSFLLGNLKDFKKKNKHRILEDWAKEYGELFTIKLGPKKILVSANHEVNTAILKQRPTKFRRLSKINEIFVEMGFHTVFNAEGDNWRKQRKPVAEALNVKNVKGYYPIIKEKTTNLLTKIDGYTSTEDDIEILNDFIAFTIDVTTEIAFGYKLNTINNKENSFQNHLELIFPLINERITAPIPFWRIFPNKKDKQLKKSLDAIEIIVNDFIKEAKGRLQNNPALQEEPSNFLEALLVESKKEGSVFDEKTLYGNVIAMLLAGEDTTSNTLAWTLYYLAQNPEMVKKIREESIQIYKTNSIPENYNQVNQLTYTNAVIQEVIRLKPTTPMLYFQANEDITLNDVFIPKDTAVITQNSYASMHDDNFSNPNKFDPKRWVKSECPYKNHEAKAIKAFGGGARLCPGMHLSIIEMTTAISSICKQYDIFLKVNPYEVEENFAFTVYPENLKVQFKKVH
ncbi:conserved hypothetical protein [Tenacibaculum sp. 190524A02b]|uniref:Cytochrome P450 n=1 Tax=Tenacibaculum vairaonense TaxID=3137860 RepID=A0ABM9PP46_9FLAO